MWLAPWCAIYLTDSWLRRNRYDPASLLASSGGLYYRQGGVHWPALIALAAGMIAAALWLNAYPPYVGPLASRLGGPLGSDFSVLLGLIAGGGVYWLLARPERAGRSPGRRLRRARPGRRSTERAGGPAPACLVLAPSDALHPAGVQRPAG